MISKPTESTTRIGKWLWLSIALGLVLGCGDSAPKPTAPTVEVEVLDAVSHPSAGAPVGVVYLRAMNRGNQAERLVSVSSSVSKTAELHETLEDGGMMRMIHRKDGFEFAANDELTLEAGGKHIMLTGLSKKLETGDSFELELVFEHAGRIRVNVPIRPRAF